MSEFSDRLASLVNRERMAAIGDAERTADLIERQIHCLALTLALCVPASKIGEILAGVETAIYESVAGSESIFRRIKNERQAES